MYYICSENKGADQLRGYCKADLRLCFSHMQKAGFLTMWLISGTVFTANMVLKTFSGNKLEGDWGEIVAEISPLKVPREKWSLP